MIKNLRSLKEWQKTFLVMAYDFIFAGVCFYLALAIRFGDFTIEKISNQNLFTYILIVSVSQFITFNLFNLYKGVWRFSSTPDLLRIIKGASVAVVFSFAMIFLVSRLDGVPRTSFLIDWALLIIALGGGRFSYRIWADNIKLNKRATGDAKKVLIYGAGDAGVKLLRDIRGNLPGKIFVVGFIDDNPAIKGKMLLNAPILGTRKHIRQVISDYDIKTVFLAIQSVTGEEIRSLYNLLEDIPVSIKVLPEFDQILSGKVDLSKFRDLRIEDLLGRDTVQLDSSSISTMISGRDIMVTGAGGSIGSVLCETILSYKPRRLIAYDNSEYNLYKLEQTLLSKNLRVDVFYCVGDIKNQNKITEILEKYRPSTVFHAAAFKHVPLMEENPVEAVQNNIYGTEVLAKACAMAEVERFVMVSTDKAVNPTSIMGASKRVAEIICQREQGLNPKTKFMTVRFGNVLGSSGSVIPLFKDQIESGGPVTVTHPEVKRYFMSIPEAAQLILQAGSFGNGGEIFILDMGTPIFIKDLACKMIRLAGHEPGVDIDVQYTGLRPGEKLFEELFLDNESLIKTVHPKVKTSKHVEIPQNLGDKIQRLYSLKSTDDKRKFKASIKDIVNEYILNESIEINEPTKDEISLH